MTDVMTGRCKACGAKFYESSPGARDEDLCDLTAPVAETAGEAVTWDHAVRLKDSVHWRLASELSADMAKAIISGDPVFDHFECIPLYTAPVPAQDDDKLREAIGHMSWMRKFVPCVFDVTEDRLNEIDDFISQEEAALKSTAAQERGE